ncbi:MAG: Txe/YoeB family addiction module toxin [Tissierellia bacterium]|nr:Txe/YoeB family addiction module toxin [Tissierellia bacterium]
MKIYYSKEAKKDLNRLREVNLDTQVKALLQLLKENPFQNPPRYESLVGDFKGLYSRKINFRHRLVYMVSEKEGKVYILRMWNHRV